MLLGQESSNKQVPYFVWMGYEGMKSASYDEKVTSLESQKCKFCWSKQNAVISTGYKTGIDDAACGGAEQEWRMFHTDLHQIKEKFLSGPQIMTLTFKEQS
jgi:hypothetical protein